MSDDNPATESISPGQERILEVAAARPELTTAEIAAETGHIVATVRDTLAAHGDAIDDQADGSTTGSKPTDSASFNATEQAVLEAALRNPDSTNREIATRVGTHVGLVRDIRDAYEAVATLPDDEPTTADEASGSAMEFNQELLSTAQEQILETARENPALTNREIADQTGTRLPLVRDTIAAHGPETAARRQAGGAKPTDSASFNETEQAVLEAALRNPEATNKEIAVRVDSHVGLVRDIRDAYEETATLPDNHDTAATATADTEAAGDHDALSETQQAILAAAADAPEDTYAEIAETVGARLPLVRDTLEAHDIDDTATAASTATDDTAAGDESLSALQQEIIEQATANPTQTYAEIAAETGARLPLVRDTLETHGDTQPA
ncbi:hypothetical protein [Halonotius sp. GCM10025705]|uniref:hypothetical protein n=1 Tax=Halonotius sp. GCM10025705 TaxID=3252678 RepID=UPI0036198E55